MNRNQVIAFMLDGLRAISPNCPEIERYGEIFSKMSEAEFKALMEDFKSGKRYLKITVPNGGEDVLSLEKNRALADKLGVKFFKQVWMPGENGSPSYLTPIKYAVLLTPMKLLAQTLAKKISVPRDQRHINSLTGQPTGASKGASMSLPEIRLCVGMGLEKTLIELVKYRGGDNRGYAAMNASLMRTGSASLETLAHFASGVQSTATLKSYLTAAHLKINL